MFSKIANRLGINKVDKECREIVDDELFVPFEKAPSSNADPNTYFGQGSRALFESAQQDIYKCRLENVVEIPIDVSNSILKETNELITPLIVRPSEKAIRNHNFSMHPIPRICSFLTSMFLRKFCHDEIGENMVEAINTSSEKHQPCICLDGRDEHRVKKAMLSTNNFNARNLNYLSHGCCVTGAQNCHKKTTRLVCNEVLFWLDMPSLFKLFHNKGVEQLLASIIIPDGIFSMQSGIERKYGIRLNLDKENDEAIMGFPNDQSVAYIQKLSVWHKYATVVVEDGSEYGYNFNLHFEKERQIGPNYIMRISRVSSSMEAALMYSLDGGTVGIKNFLSIMPILTEKLRASSFIKPMIFETRRLVELFESCPVITVSRELMTSIDNFLYNRRDDQVSRQNAGVLLASKLYNIVIGQHHIQRGMTISLEDFHNLCTICIIRSYLARFRSTKYIAHASNHLIKTSDVRSTIDTLVTQAKIKYNLRKKDVVCHTTKRDIFLRSLVMGDSYKNELIRTLIFDTERPTIKIIRQMAKEHAIKEYKIPPRLPYKYDPVVKGECFDSCLKKLNAQTLDVKWPTRELADEFLDKFPKKPNISMEDTKSGYHATLDSDTYQFCEHGVYMAAYNLPKPSVIVDTGNYFDKYYFKNGVDTDNFEKTGSILSRVKAHCNFEKKRWKKMRFLNGAAAPMNDYMFWDRFKKVTHCINPEGITNILPTVRKQHEMKVRVNLLCQDCIKDLGKFDVAYIDVGFDSKIDLIATQSRVLRNVTENMDKETIILVKLQNYKDSLEKGVAGELAAVLKEKGLHLFKNDKMAVNEVIATNLNLSDGVPMLKESSHETKFYGNSKCEKIDVINNKEDVDETYNFNLNQKPGHCLAVALKTELGEESDEQLTKDFMEWNKFEEINENELLAYFKNGDWDQKCVDYMPYFLSDKLNKNIRVNEIDTGVGEGIQLNLKNEHYTRAQEEKHKPERTQEINDEILVAVEEKQEGKMDNVKSLTPMKEIVGMKKNPSMLSINKQVDKFEVIIKADLRELLKDEKIHVMQILTMHKLKPQGLAAALPNAYEATASCDMHGITRMGNLLNAWVMLESGNWRYGKDTDEDRLDRFRKALEGFDFTNVETLYFPHHGGCDIAGGDVSKWHKLLNDFFNKISTNLIYVLPYKKKTLNEVLNNLINTDENSDWHPNGVGSIASHKDLNLLMTYEGINPTHINMKNAKRDDCLSELPFDGYAYRLENNEVIGPLNEQKEVAFTPNQIDLKNIKRYEYDLIRELKNDNNKIFKELHHKCAKILEENTTPDECTVNVTEGTYCSGKTYRLVKLIKLKHPGIRRKNFNEMLVITPTSKLAHEYTQQGIPAASWSRAITLLDEVEKISIYIDEAWMLDTRLIPFLASKSKEMYMIGDSRQLSSGDGKRKINYPILTDILKEKNTRLSIAQNTPLDVVIYNNTFEPTKTITRSRIVNSVNYNEINSHKEISRCEVNCKDQHQHEVLAAFSTDSARNLKCATVAMIQGLRTEEMKLFIGPAADLLLKVQGQRLVATTRHTKILNLFAQKGTCYFNSIKIPQFKCKCKLVGARNDVLTPFGHYDNNNTEFVTSVNGKIHLVEAGKIHEAKTSDKLIEQRRISNECKNASIALTNNYEVNRYFVGKPSVSVNLPMMVDLDKIAEEDENEIRDNGRITIGQIEQPDLSSAIISKLNINSSRFCETDRTVCYQKMRGPVGNHILNIKTDKPLVFNENKKVNVQCSKLFGSNQLNNTNHMLNTGIERYGVVPANEMTYEQEKELGRKLIAGFDKLVDLNALRPANEYEESMAEGAALLRVCAKINQKETGVYGENFDSTNRIKCFNKQQLKVKIGDEAHIMAKEKDGELYPKGGQMVSAQPKEVNQIAAASVNWAERCVFAAMRPGVFPGYGYSPRILASKVRDRLAIVGSGKETRSCDISEQDTCKSLATDLLMRCIYEKCGIDEKVVSILEAPNHIWMMKNDVVKTRVKYQFQSGRADTLFSNTCHSLAIAGMSFDFEELKILLAQGDDIMVKAEDIRTTVDFYPKLKVDDSAVGDFTGFLIDDVSLVLDLPRLVAKCLSRTIDDEGRREQLRQATKDIIAFHKDHASETRMKKAVMYKYGKRENLNECITEGEVDILWEYMDAFASFNDSFSPHKAKNYEKFRCKAASIIETMSTTLSFDYN